MGNSGKKTRYVTISGADGVGKTSLINGLKKILAERGVPVHSTRLLGGDGTDDFQLALRKVLLHPKFPKDSVELEESLFAMTDVEGVRAARAFLRSTPDGVVLKDRGVPDHVTYAMAKGMGTAAIAGCHDVVLHEEKATAKEYGYVCLIMVPKDVRFTMERIRARAAASGEPIVERLENDHVQWSVMNAVREFPNHVLAQGLRFRVLEVAKEDTMQDVLQAAVGVLREEGVEL